MDWQTGCLPVHCYQKCFRGELLKQLGELLDDAGAEHIGHGQCLEMNLIVSSNGCSVIAVEVGDCFLEGEVQRKSER